MEEVAKKTGSLVDIFSIVCFLPFVAFVIYGMFLHFRIVNLVKA